MKRYLVLLLLLCSAVALGGTPQTITTLPQMNTSFAPNAIEFMRHEDALRDLDKIADYVALGLGAPASVTLSHTLASGAAYVRGYVVQTDAVVLTYTPSRRTYLFLDALDQRLPTVPEITFTGGSGCTFKDRPAPHMVRAECSAGSIAPVPSSPLLLVHLIDTNTTAVEFVGRLASSQPFPASRVRGLYDVREFGALIDGVSDDAPAMRHAMSQLAAAGGGIIRIPDGVINLVPRMSESFYFAHIPSNTVIECGKNTVLKLGGPSTLPGQGMGFFWINSANNVTIRNCIFDYNAHTWLAGEPLQIYTAINVEGSSTNILIEGNEFRNNPGTNTVVCGGTGSRCIIRGNRFVNGGQDIVGGNPNAVDHTSIYTWSQGPIVEDNIIEWEEALGEPTHARSGIEIHTGPGGTAMAIVRGNRISWSTLGIRLEVDLNGQQLVETDVLDNRCDNCIAGIWLTPSGAVTTGADMRRIRISRNHVTVHKSPFMADLPHGIGMSRNTGNGKGLAVLYASSITDNTIEVASPTLASPDGYLGLEIAAARDVLVEGNHLVNGTVMMLQGTEEGIIGLTVRGNIFSNVQNFPSPGGLIRVNFAPIAGLNPGGENIVFDLNNMLRYSGSPAVPNVYAWQVDYTVGSSVVSNMLFNFNYINGVNPAFIGTAGATNIFSQSLMGLTSDNAIMAFAKGVAAVTNGVVFRNDVAPSASQRSLVKIERGSDGTRNLFVADTNGATDFIVNPQGDIAVGADDFFQRGHCTFANLGANTPGTVCYCTNCNTPAAQGDACAATAGDNAGAKAERIRGVWKCY